VLSPSSILPPSSSNCALIPASKNLAHILNMLSFDFFFIKIAHI
jgi:hypothetical protein